MARTEDSHLARQPAQASPVPVTDPVDTALPESFPVVPVRDEAPALGIGRCVRLSAANPVVSLLAQDPRRRLAIVLAVDNDVYLASSKELAEAVAGSAAGSDAFYLPAGIAMAIPNKAAWWAAATTTGSTSRVSVLVSKDDV